MTNTPRKSTGWLGPTGVEGEKGWEEQFNVIMEREFYGEAASLISGQGWEEKKYAVLQLLSRAHAAGYDAGLQAAEDVLPEKRDLERAENTAVNYDPAVAFNHGVNVCREAVLSALQSLRRSNEV
jgi:hypothetical protein